MKVVVTLRGVAACRWSWREEKRSDEEWWWRGVVKGFNRRARMSVVVLVLMGCYLIYCFSMILFNVHLGQK